MGFKENLRILRLNASLTQEQLGNKVCVHFNTVSKWERGETAPDLSLYGPLSSALSVSLEKLLGIEEKDCQSGNFDALALGRTIAKQRKRFALSQSDLAKRLQTSSDIVSKWERGIVSPRIEQVVEMASLFEVSVSALYFAKASLSLVPIVSEKKSSKILITVAVFLVALVLAFTIFFVADALIKANYQDAPPPNPPTQAGEGKGDENAEQDAPLVEYGLPILGGEVLLEADFRNLIYNETLKQWMLYKGIVIGAEAGASVLAVCDGTITRINKYTSLGYEVCIVDETGITFNYIGVEAVSTLTVGASVSRGETIGFLQSSIMSEVWLGTHLRLEVSNDEGKKINPRELIDFN